MRARINVSLTPAERALCGHATRKIFAPQPVAYHARAMQRRGGFSMAPTTRQTAKRSRHRLLRSGQRSGIRCRRSYRCNGGIDRSVAVPTQPAIGGGRMI
jgi:hypothetical protein